MPALHNALPERRKRYVEPFAGSAAFFFSLLPDSALISDINADLMNFYQQLQLAPDELWKSLSCFPDTEAGYYAARSLDRRQLSSVTAAARFLFLNRRSFNGIYRTNRKNEFNVPYGRRTGLLPSLSELQRVSSSIQTAIFEEADFEDSLDNAEEGDFAYLDPPYFSSQRATYGEYGYGSFRGTDEVRLVQAINRACARNVSIMLSYSTKAITEDLVGNWQVSNLERPNRLAASVDSRTQRREVLLTNYSRLISKP